jgi:hypothetical protein
MLHFFLFETKCFNGELEINDRGEFTMGYAGERRFGIESPLEQSLRHERSKRSADPIFPAEAEPAKLATIARAKEAKWKWRWIDKGWSGAWSR